MRRICQADDRPEVVVVGVDFIRHQKLGRIETGKSRKFEGTVCRLAKILVSEAHRQRQSLVSFPGVLEEITLTKKIGMINRIADIYVGAATGAAEVIDEVRQRREGSTGECAAISKGKRTAFIKWRMLPRNLFQKLGAKPKRVRAVNLRHGVLKQIIFGDAKLWNVGSNSNGRQIRDADVRHREG